MKYALIVAWREFAENAKTKGFWISICVFPLIIFLSVQVPILLEKKGTPTRHYVLVDQTGQFEQVIEDKLDKEYQAKLLQALNEYAEKYGSNKSAGSQASNAPASDVPSPKRLRSAKDFSDKTPPTLEAFLKSGGLTNYLRQLQPILPADAPKFTEPRRNFHRIANLPPGLRAYTNNLHSLAQELKPYLKGDKKVMAGSDNVDLYAAILVPADLEKQIVRPGQTPMVSEGEPKGVQYWSVNLADMKLREDVEQSINNEIRRREYVNRGMDLVVIRQIERTYAPVTDLNPKKETGKETVGMADVMRQWAPTAFVYLLWIAIFSIVQMLLNNTIEEKSNRIIEVLLSSVTPGELMMGKLAGIAAVGLTMIGAWLLALVGILAWKSGSASSLAGPMFTILRTSNLVPAFVVYFILGFLLYSGVILSIGSVCNTIKEAQNYMGVITLFLMVPLLTMMFIPKDPNGTLATVLSWIPIYTPFIMMNRITADPPLLDIIGTMLLLLATTALVLWSAGKIFRIGVLRTGQPPKLLEMLRWLRN